MAKAELQTQRTGASVEAFLNSIENKQRRDDGFEVLEMMQRLSGEKAEMWGPAIIGFGRGVLKYASGRELDWMLIAFSPRKANMTLYLTNGYAEYDGLLAKLGKHKTSKACLYINRLSDVDRNVLEELIECSIRHARTML